MDPVTAVAPGKLIVSGEHAVVYQRPALVSAVDLWLRATVSPRSEPGVGIDLVELDHRETTGWPSLREYADMIRERWEAYAERPTAEAFAHMQGKDPAHIVKVALGEAARRIPDAATPSVDVTVRSEQPIGAGFGSSAAVAVAVVQAYLAVQNVEMSDDALYELVLDVERRQHGTPSGVDPATVLQGGLVWAERTGDRLAFRSGTARSPLLDAFRVFDTGTPRESTGTVVDAVRAFREENPDAFRAALDQIETGTRALRTVLVQEEAQPDETIRIVRRVEAALETLGVVPDPVQQLIRTIEDHGGAAKISGAGALSGSKAGSLLVYHPDPEAAVWNELRHLPEIDVHLGAEGAHVETVGA